ASDLVLMIGVIVVVAEHRDHGHRDVREILRERARLLHQPVVREVSAQQHHVGLLRDLVEQWHERCLRLTRVVHVGQGGDPESAAGFDGGARRFHGGLLTSRSEQEPGPRTRSVFVNALKLLSRAGVPFLVGGAYAFERHTGIARHTRDLDVFIREQDFPDLRERFESGGYRADVPFPHWVGKVYKGRTYVDLIFSSGNGMARVDDGWFEHAVDGEVLGVPVRLCAVEEMIWSKAFIMERERFDGADVLHLLHERASVLDWHR